MTPELQAVLKLQTLDARAAALQKEIESLPKQVAEIEKKLDAHTRKLDVDRNVMAANQKERKLWKTISRFTSRRSRSFGIRCCRRRPTINIAPSKTKSHTAKPRFANAEDRILDLMGEAEPLENNVKTAEAALKEEKPRSRRRKNGQESGRPKTKNFSGKRWRNAKLWRRPSRRRLLSALRTDPQTLAWSGHRRCDRRTMRRVPDEAATAVLPGASSGRQVIFLRELRPNSVLQSSCQPRTRDPFEGLRLWIVLPRSTL